MNNFEAMNPTHSMSWMYWRSTFYFRQMASTIVGFFGSFKQMSTF